MCYKRASILSICVMVEHLYNGRASVLWCSESAVSVGSSAGLCWPVLAIKRPTSRFLIKKLLLDAYHQRQGLLFQSEGLLFHSEHVQEKISKTKEMCARGSVWKRKKERKKKFIKIENIWYYNVYIPKLKLSKLFIPTIYITVTPHAENLSMFIRQISYTWSSLFWLYRLNID